MHIESAPDFRIHVMNCSGGAAGCQPLAQRCGIDEGAVNPLGRGVEDAMDDAEMIRPAVPPRFRPFLRRSGVRGE